MQLFMRGFVAVLLLLLADGACAASQTPAGLWKTIDDNTGETKALIRIVEQEGKLQGRIEKIFQSADEEPDPKCKKCDGEQKEKPIVGMTILSGLARQEDEYKGGQILDPESGNVYRCSIRVSDDGRKLEVRGYIGIPLFGRRQTWVRAE